MSVTVKVFCQLAAVFLVVFLDQTIAKRNYEAKFYDPSIPKTIYIYSEIPYSDNDNRAVDETASRVVKEYDRPKRECGQSECYSEEFPETKNEYDKEQYWNKDEVEVEDIGEDIKSDAEVNSREKRSTHQIRHHNHRYDDEDSASEESRQTPRNAQQYEVYEIDEGEEEILPSEPRIHIQTPPPDVFVYNGVRYLRKPDSSKAFNLKKQNINQEASDSDSTSAETGKSKVHSGSFVSKKDQRANRDSTHGEKSNKGYTTIQRHEQGAKGNDVKEKHAKHYDEHGGKKHNNRDEASNHGQHQEAAQGHKGAKFDEKEAHKKGHNTKGYHNKYQKDEYHKEHKFYDDYQKSGSHSRYGNSNSKHSSKEGGQKKKAHHDGSSHEDKSGKSGQYSKGRVDEGHKSHKSEKGYEKYNGQNSDYGKKGGDQRVVYHKY